MSTTAQVLEPQRGIRRWLRPAILLPGIVMLLVVVALLTPESAPARGGDQRLTTYSTSAGGAQVLYDLARRLGFDAQRRTAGSVVPPDVRTIYAVMDPAAELRASDAHALLEHLRAGGGLLFVLGNGSEIADSLHVRIAGMGGTFQPVLDAADRGARCEGADRGALPLWPDHVPRMYAIRMRGGLPPEHRVFAWSTSEKAPEAAAIGFPFGKGRVVVVSDPDMLRNDVLRVCGWNADVVAVRMLEYLRDGGSAPRRQLVFDEYHQGYGLQPGSTRAIAVFLLETRPGRALAQILLAAVVLLLATGARFVPPVEERTIERRSPFEHVDALAHAYERVGATRVAAQRLLHGVRRRTRRSLRSFADLDDRAFLAAVRQAHPSLGDDTSLVSRALETPSGTRELEAVGAAIRRIETTLSSPIT